MAKRLSLNDINKEHKKLTEQKLIYILDDKYEVKIDKIIVDSKLVTMLSDLNQLISPLVKDKNIKPEELVLAMQLSNVLFLRSFTNLPIPPENDLSVLVQVYTQLVDIGILKEVTDKFDQSELKKVQHRVSDYYKNAPQVENMIGQVYAKMLKGDHDAEIQEH
ncbi:hypothetical protein EEL31_10390 [Brevibacillus laterosporus]|nr:hypothetical protein [Brevibacillus laterosporus]TPG68897.1 hypothetical protein EEL31_10390 [Brevibacillus laterosporus]